MQIYLLNCELKIKVFNHLLAFWTSNKHLASPLTVGLHTENKSYNNPSATAYYKRAFYKLLFHIVMAVGHN